MDGRRKSNTILITIVHCVVKLHEDVAKDMHLLETDLVDSKRLDDIATFAAVLVVSVNLSCDPVVAWHVVFDSINNISQVWER